MAPRRRPRNMVNTTARMPPKDPEFIDSDNEAEREQRARQTGDVNQLRWSMKRDDLDSIQQLGQSSDIPASESVEDEIQRSGPAELKRKLTLDMSNFITSKVSERRVELDKKIAKLVEGVWGRVPPMPVRGHYANFISYFMTYVELYEFTKFFFEKEYEHETESYIPCHQFQVFEDYFPTVQACYKNGEAPLSEFAHLLNIRDCIVDSFRDHFTIGLPMLNKTELIKFLENKYERYEPFDFEWLSSSVVLGDYAVPFAKYLANIRLNQMELSMYRADLVGMLQGDNVRFLNRIRTPLPRHADCPMNIAKKSVAEEANLRRDFIGRYVTLCKSKTRNTWATNLLLKMEKFNELCGMVSRLKKKIIDEITYCENKYLKGRFRVITLLTSVDTLLLILQKVYALYVDKDKGLIGVIVEERVLTPLTALIRLADEKNFQAKQPNKEIVKKLEEFRDLVRGELKIYYEQHELNCQKHVTGAPDNSDALGRRRVNVIPQDFPDEISQFIPRMFKLLNQQYAEIDRILFDRYRIRYVRTFLNMAPKLRVNECQKITSFFCNFDERIDVSDSDRAIMEKRRIKLYVPLEKLYGEEIIRMTHEVMERHQGVPSSAEVREALEEAFEAEIKTQLIHNKNAEQLGAMFSEMVCMDIILSRFREMIPKARSKDIAKEMAERLVDVYLTHACQYATYSKIERTSTMKALQEQEQEDDTDDEDFCTDDDDDDEDSDTNSNEHYKRVFEDLANNDSDDSDEDGSVPDAIVNDFIAHVMGVSIFPAELDQLMNVPLD